MRFTLITLIETTAVVSSAIYGVILAARKRMDITGVFAVAFAVAFGGGTLRDLFLDRHPLFWIANPGYPVIVFLIAIGATLIVKFVRRLKNLLIVCDALGMGLFAISGAKLALDSGTTMFLASLLGVVTGTFGGVLGDIICNEVPSLFKSSPLSATCAFTGAWVYLVSQWLGLSDSYAMILGVCVVFVFRLLAVRFDLLLPTVAPTESEGVGRNPPGDLYCHFGLNIPMRNFVSDNTKGAMMKPTKTLIIAGSLAWAGMTAHADHRSIDLNPALEYERGTDRLKKHVAREFRYHHGHRGYDLYLALLRTVNCLEDYGDKAGKYRGRPDLLCVLKSKSDPLIVDARRLGRAAGMSREFWIEMRRG